MDLEVSTRSQRFDGFVIDWIVGETTAINLISSLRVMQPRVPIVVLTGHVLDGVVDEGDIAKAVQQFGLVFSEKPVRMSILSATLSLAFYASFEPTIRES